MDIALQDLPFDASTVPGLSQQLLLSHHQNNYGGAVKRLNAIRSQLNSVDFASAPGFQLNGLKREELIAHNSMVLHELYFASLSSAAAPMTPACSLALEASFGSAARWAQEFSALGKALGGGSGWVLLSYLPREGRLVNQWASDHSQAFAGATPILALDMYEHAYHLDFGAAAGRYVDTFMGLIDWAAVYARYQVAVEAASAACMAGPEAVPGCTLIDVRRAGVYASATQLIEGAQWRDPAHIASWAPTLAKDQAYLLYCVYGHEVSQAAALRLRAAGLNAQSLQGGIDAWAAAGRPLTAKALALPPATP